MKRSVLLLAALALLASPRAFAAGGTSGFALDRFEPAERGSDFFLLDTLSLMGDPRLAVGFTLDLGHKPLVVFDQNGAERTALVRDQLFAHLGASVVLFDRLRLGLNVPVALYQSGDAATVNGNPYTPATKAALGDPRLAADLRLLGQPGEAFVLAAGVRAFVPLGNQEQYAGDGKVRVQPRLMAAGRLGGVFEYAGQLSFTYRAQGAVIDGLPLGNEVGFGVGAGLRPVEALLVGPELYGATEVSGTDPLPGVHRSTPLELIVGAHYQLGDFKLGAGVGPGLTRGVGTPQVRGLFSFEYAPPLPRPIADRDGDGIPDAQDACPDQKGLASADPRANGCPDRDGDGIADPLDACPDQKGVATSDPRTNGCPPKAEPPPDRDHDGVADAQDACPDLPGVATADPTTNGCPPDRDHDGVPDAQDACPDVPGVATSDPKTNGCPGDRDGDGIRDDQDACPDVAGIPELKGCPDVDTDKDGIPDRLDNCPKEPGPKENGGCPLKQKQLVIITKEKLEIKDKVYFDTGKATIQKKSFGLLDQVARIISEHPDIAGIRVEGHTDNVGSAELNRTLSRARAESVKTYLVGKGVDAARLTAEGFGPDRPIDSNKTAKGKANNRRVEFFIAGTPGALAPEPAPTTPKEEPKPPAPPAKKKTGKKANK
jgi:OOP family OmpA-OmpF porin